MKKIDSRLLAPVIVTLFFGGILVSMGMNLWITESTKVAARYTSGEFAGTANPGDIRGSYSLSDIEDNFGIPVAVTARAFGAESWPVPADFKAKDLEALYLGISETGEIGTDSVRLFVARYLGLPYTPEETTVLPLSAIGELREKLAPADLKALEKIAVDTAAIHAGSSGSGTQTAAAQPIAQPAAEPTEDDRAIKGKTTFNDLLSWGVSKATIERIMGMEIGPVSVTVRDFCIGKGLEFSEYRAALQEAVPAQ